jgi:site-specific DNA-methyltransferase (adenine-specific)
MKGQEQIFSSASDEWATPRQFFSTIDEEFHFTLDPCATSQNSCCEKFYTMEDDGLSKDWSNEIVFCNPPYSQIKKWVEKCSSEASHATIVLLIPSRTDTIYFHNFIYNKAEIRFIKGRLKFGNNKNSAPFPSMLVIWRNKNANQ